MPPVRAGTAVLEKTLGNLGQAKGIAQVSLGHAHQLPAQPHSLTGVHIDRAWPSHALPEPSFGFRHAALHVAGKVADLVVEGGDGLTALRFRS